MLDITIHKATLNDFTAVSTLLAELGRPALTDDLQEEQEKIYKEYLEQKSHTLLLAMLGEQVIGMLALEIRQRLSQTQPEAWVPEFVVSELVRGKKVGHLLFEAAHRLAEKHDCHRMVIETGHQRTIAHHFLEQHGMELSGRYYTMTL